MKVHASFGQSNRGSLVFGSDGVNELVVEAKESKFAQTFIRVMSQLGQHNWRALLSSNQVPPSSERDAGGGRNKAIRRAPVPWWSNLIKLFYFYWLIKMIIYLVLQHNYDIAMYNFRSGFKAATFTQFNDSSAIEALEQIDSARANLKSIGAPLMHMGFVLEIVNILFISILHLGYMQPQIHTNYIAPVYHSLVEYILDPVAEQQAINRDIRKEVDKFLVSSENYDKVLHHIENQRDCSLQAENCHHLHRVAEFNHLKMVKIINLMLARGDLQPTNRRPEWISKCANRIVQITISVASFGVILGIFFGHVAPYMFERFRPESDPRDMLFLCELHLALVLGTSIIGFNYALIVFACLDQIKLLSGLVEQILECKSKNNSLLLHNNEIHEQPLITNLDSSKQIFNKQQSTTDLITRDINTNLGRIYLQYKLFVTQLRPIKQMGLLAIVLASILLIVMPILGRAYAVYLDILDKFFIAAGSVFITVVADLFLVMPCYIKSRCDDLYRVMAGLVAHTIEFSANISPQLELKQRSRESAVEKRNVVENNDNILQHLTPPAYDKHLVRLLRKEMDYPDRFSERLTVGFLGQTACYPNFLRFQFWLGLSLFYMLMF